VLNETVIAALEHIRLNEVCILAGLLEEEK
jgi:hypothetical protein